MKRSWHIWICFVLCLAVVMAAMGWISLAAVGLDRAEAEARRQAALEENVRLALWRIDSALAPLVAQESVRPYFAYSAFLAVDRTYSQMFNDRGGGEMLIPSPLLTANWPNILVYFQFEPDGRLTSPQVPTGTNFKLAVPQHLTAEAVREAESRLAPLEQLIDRNKLLQVLPDGRREPVEMVFSPLAQTTEQRLAQRQRRLDVQRRGRGAVEFNERSQAFEQHANVMVRNRDLDRFNDLFLPSTDVSGVVMTPLWIDGRLILARRIAAGGREYVQGCLLDWPAIKTSLLETVEDLLPAADLQPVTVMPEEQEGRMLAALPVRLIPGRLAGDRDRTLSPILFSLWVAWGCVLLAAIAVAVLTAGVIRLSERRASFVTAVTHELRTPLTTFQMYAEMLAEGMVPDEIQQRQYLGTLRNEADRLTHLVENVLSYARLERGRADGRLVSVTLDQLVESLADRLASRAEGAGMELVVEKDHGVSEIMVRVNTSAAEQILFNLVDNGCKYAAGAADKRIHLAVQQDGEVVRVSLRDHGPGVSPSARRRLFRPFSKSAREAAQTAPGVGLGLALSRRLARDMDGDLRLDESVTDGACFVLTLPSVQ